MSQSKQTGNRNISHDPLVFSVFSREIARPLREILNHLQSQSERRLDAETREQHLASCASMGAVLSLLDTFRHLPAIDEGRLDLDVSVFELADVVRGVHRSLEPLASRRGAVLTELVDRPVAGRFVGDTSRLRQMLTYVTNLALEMAPGGPILLQAMPDVTHRNTTTVRFQVVCDGSRLPAHRRDQLVVLNDTGPETPLNVLDESASVGWHAYQRLARLMGGRLGVDFATDGRFALWATTRLYRPGTVCEEREDQRRLQEMLHCNHGPVIDLSSTGMRMLSKRPRKGRIGVRMLNTPMRLRLQGQVVWHRQVSRTQHEIGVRFVGLRPEQQGHLSQVADSHHAS